MKPIVCFWDGAVLVPLFRFVQLAKNQFVIGQQYRMVSQHDRSVASHNHYFASIDTLWRKLLWRRGAEQFATAEKLRHHALIRTGYYHSRWETFSTRKDAEKAAALLRRYLDLAEVEIEGARVTVLTAQSQASAVMGEQDFKASKKDVLEYIEKMLNGREPSHDIKGDLSAS